MIDKDDAPEGYEAAHSADGCDGCDFEDNGCHKPWEAPSCALNKRMDRQEVIFIKKDATMQITTHGFAGAMRAEDVRAALDRAIYELHTLRDAFAKAALTGMLAGTEMAQSESAFATDSYILAEAMLDAKFSSMTWWPK